MRYFICKQKCNLNYMTNETRLMITFSSMRSVFLIRIWQIYIGMSYSSHLQTGYFFNCTICLNFLYEIAVKGFQMPGKMWLLFIQVRISRYLKSISTANDNHLKKCLLVMWQNTIKRSAMQRVSVQFNN